MSVSAMSEQTSMEASGAAKTSAVPLELISTQAELKRTAPFTDDEAQDAVDQENPQTPSEHDEEQDESEEPGANTRVDDTTLPSSPGSLPPRKRAKTKDEKEQRRIERIMRNRQAAHASREKKRRHVEELETKCSQLSQSKQELEEQLKLTQRAQVQAEEQHMALQTRLDQLEAAVQLARTSGDVSVLESMLAVLPSISPADTHATVSMQAVSAPVASASQPLLSDLEGASADVAGNVESMVDSEAVELPGLTYSPLNSPPAYDDSDYDGLDLSIHTFTTPTSYLNSSFSKTHHPAAMMC